MEPSHIINAVAYWNRLQAINCLRQADKAQAPETKAYLIRPAERLHAQADRLYSEAAR